MQTVQYLGCGVWDVGSVVFVMFRCMYMFVCTKEYVYVHVVVHVTDLGVLLHCAKIMYKT